MIEIAFLTVAAFAAGWFVAWCCGAFKAMGCAHCEELMRK